MTRRDRCSPRVRAARELYAPPCSHCGTPRIVASLSEFIGIARRQNLRELGDAFAAMSAWYASDDRLSMCPGCMCITGDLDVLHDH